MNDLDLYVGVSAGAAAASLVANGVTPREILETNLSEPGPTISTTATSSFHLLSERDSRPSGASPADGSIAQALAYVTSRNDAHRSARQGSRCAAQRHYTLEPFAAYLAAIFRRKG